MMACIFGFDFEKEISYLALRAFALRLAFFAAIGNYRQVRRLKRIVCRVGMRC